MKDLNEWTATGIIASVERKEYNDKSFIEAVLNNKNYKGESVQIPFSVWGKAQEEFAAQVGDLVAVKGEIRSKQNGQYLNTSVSVYAVEVLSGGGLEPAAPVEEAQEIDLGDSIPF